MKIIYNNNKIFINKNNISVYHLISLFLDENIENYYLQTINGKILEYNEIVDNKEIYYIKRRLIGGNNTLHLIGNSFIITIGSAILYGFITIFYYKFYLNSILDSIIELPKNKTKMTGGENNKNISTTNSNTNFRILIKDYFFKFIFNIQDDSFIKYKCDLFPEKKETVLGNNQTGIGPILSFALFATFIFMLLIPLFINTATISVCGKPKYSNIIYSIIFIFIPLILALTIPIIFKGIYKIFNYYGKDISFLTNYKLAFSNIIIISILILYIILNKKGLSGIMIGMFPIVLIIFIVIKYIPFISNIFDFFSIFISNIITNTTPVPSRSDNNNSNSPAPECWKRYNFIYSLFEVGITTLIGWVVSTIIYASQINKYCSV